MIVLTGGSGFIGSVILGYLNSQGIDDIIIVDDLKYENQFKNLIGKKFSKLYTISDAESNIKNADIVLHFGANANTLCKDWNDIYYSNIQSTRFWRNFCRKKKSKLIFASSAATYGNGAGPLNQYAFSKHISETELTDSCILRLFNVYGPNEYHKSRMASTIFHWYNQHQTDSKISLFKNSEDFYRDFIYVEDVAKIVYFLMKNYRPGIFDVGTGKSESFKKLSEVFVDQFNDCAVEYKSMPDDLLSQYQTYTNADIENIKKIGFDTNKLLTIKQGTEKYIEYLKNNNYY